MINIKYLQNLQNMDYEGIPFRCIKWFNIGSLQMVKTKKSSSLWKGASFEHYTISKKSFS